MTRVRMDEEAPLVTREPVQTWCFAKRKLWGTISLVSGTALFIFAFAMGISSNALMSTWPLSVRIEMGASGCLMLFGACCRCDCKTSTSESISHEHSGLERYTCGHR